MALSIVLLMQATSSSSIEVCHDKRRKGAGQNEWPSNREGRRRRRRRRRRRSEDRLSSL
jgi:hypothetical protein